MELLLEPGDSAAPVGSHLWCVDLHHSACALRRSGDFALNTLKFSLLSLRDKGYFRSLLNRQGKPFEKWADYVSAEEPFGLGLRIEVATAVMDRASPGINAIVAAPKGGTAAMYLAGRIKREAPDVWASLDRHKSVQAAAIAAGVINRATTPVERLRAAWQEADEAERMAFLAEVADRQPSGT